MAEVIRGSKAEQLKVFLPNSKDRCVVWLEPEFIEAIDLLTSDRKTFLTQAITNIEGNRASAIRCYVVEQLLNERQTLKQLLGRWEREVQPTLSEVTPIEPPLTTNVVPLFDVEPSKHPLQLIYNFPSKNRKRDILNAVNKACAALGFDANNLTLDQENQIIEWHGNKFL